MTTANVIIFYVLPCQIQEQKDGTRTLEDVEFDKSATILCCEGLNLTSLKGCAEHFFEIRAAKNKLSDFTGFPQNVLRVDVSHNRYKTLEGMPLSTLSLRISNNPLESLKGCNALLKSLGCSFSHLRDFEGCGSFVSEITAVQCCLESFKGLPPVMNRLYASMNRLSDWKDCPIVKNLDLGGNLFKTISGCKEGVIELCLSNNDLEDLKGAPSTLTRLRVARNPRIKSLEGLSTCLNLQVLKINDCNLEDISDLPLMMTSFFAKGNPRLKMESAFLDSQLFLETFVIS